jgi:uncharacterized protein YprB with RNaseH-like and TPR domain
MNLRQLKKEEILFMATHRCKHRHTFLEHPDCYNRPPEKIGFLDIEASNLNADFGIMLSYCIKELDGEVIGSIIKPKELRTSVLDGRVVENCIKDMKKFDRIITYYGTGFDLPFIRTRSLLYGWDFPVYKELQHTDVFYWAKSKLCLHRKRLQVVCDFLGIPSKGHPMITNVWTRAMTGDKEALSYIYEHNQEDVVSLEEVYKCLLDYTANRSNSV